MNPAVLVRNMRDETGLSVRALADAAGVAASTVHRIEMGQLHPTVETVHLLAEAAGFRLRLDVEQDYAASIIGLGRFVSRDVANGETATAVRRAAEFGHDFMTAEDESRRRMIAGEPTATGDSRWDAFLAALTEWLAVKSGIDAPAWSLQGDRFLHQGWWVTPMESMRAWEYAGSPGPFKNRGVYIHRDSLINV